MLSRYKPVNTPTRHWISGMISLCVSLCLLLAGAVNVSNAFDFIASASRASGVVVRQTAGKHHVAIRFTTAEGSEVEYGQNGLISYEAGDKVTVLYDSGNPGLSPSTDSFGALWGGSLFFFAMGAGFALMSWLAVLKPHFIVVNGIGG